MALTNCVECGKAVSTQAAACPHCGMKMPKKSAWPTVVMSILAVPAAILVAAALFGESNEKRQGRYQVARAECIQLSVKAGFAAPGSFDRAHEAITVKTLKECMSAWGFDVQFK